MVSRKDEKVSALLTELDTRLSDFMTSEGFRAYLDTMRKFHRYSPTNLALIVMQCPEATMVAGYRRWQELGRQVRRGECGIKILAPSTRKETIPETGEEEIRVTGFRVVSVFDYSQTDGDPLPEMEMPTMLTGGGTTEQRLIRELRAYLVSQNVTVKDVDDLGGANGSYNHQTRTISMVESLPQAQYWKTLCHESAHWLTYELDVPQELRRHRSASEAIAESTAYVVAGAFGLDTSEYSIPYVAGWAEDLELVRSLLDVVHKIGTMLIQALEGRVRDEVEVVATTELADVS